jgi:hypothetical protein
MRYNQFLFFASPEHFPNFVITVPFYFTVMYSITEFEQFNKVESVAIPFTAIGACYFGAKLAGEIEQAAKSNFKKVPDSPDPDDLKNLDTFHVAGLNKENKD